MLRQHKKNYSSCRVDYKCLDDFNLHAMLRMIRMMDMLFTMTLKLRKLLIMVTTKKIMNFYEVDDYVEPNRTASDGTADIADAPDEMEGVNPGNIYVDNQSIKEDVDNPYTILLFSGSMPTVYKYNKEQPDDPWTVVSQEKVNLLEGKVNKVSKSYLIFTDQNNDDIKVKIKKDEQWHPGDEIKVFGLTKTKDGKVKLAKQYGYYKVE